MKRNFLRIRPMIKDDINRIIEIEEAVYGSHHWSRDSFYSELTNNLAHYFTAINDKNIVVGYIGGWIIVDEAHVTNVSVHPDFRKNSYGEALLVHFIENAYKNEVKYITLEVRKSNVVAINLYEKYTFKSLGLRKGYYQDNNEDALIMWTENIFWDKFKLNFEKNIKKLEEKIDIV